MPIYEYRCTSCGHTLEVIQKINDKPLKKCTECSGALEKLISRSAFQLRGGGWYNEGYGGQGRSSSTSSSSSPSSTESGSNGGKTTDTKPEGGKKAAAGGCGSGGCGCH
jgi:putative FmdB family regulatory protein